MSALEKFFVGHAGSREAREASAAYEELATKVLEDAKSALERARTVAESGDTVQARKILKEVEAATAALPEERLAPLKLEVALANLERKEAASPEHTNKTPGPDANRLARTTSTVKSGVSPPKGMEAAVAAEPKLGEDLREVLELAGWTVQGSWTKDLKEAGRIRVRDGSIKRDDADTRLTIKFELESDAKLAAYVRHDAGALPGFLERLPRWAKRLRKRLPHIATGYGLRVSMEQIEVFAPGDLLEALGVRDAGRKVEGGPIFADRKTWPLAVRKWDASSGRHSICLQVQGPSLNIEVDGQSHRARADLRPSGHVLVKVEGVAALEISGLSIP
jgi:hypothetical protein